MRMFFFVALLALISQITYATESDDTCASGGMHDMAECKSSAYKNNTVILDDKYRKAMSHVQLKEAKATLKKSQDLWLKFVEAKCAFQALPYSGWTNHGIFYACMNAETKMRIKDLESIASCSTNDCP